MRKVLVLLLMAGLLLGACAFQIVAESIYVEGEDFTFDETLGDPVGGPIPCGGGEGNGGGGLPG
jgi:hypothetical protein